MRDTRHGTRGLPGTPTLLRIYDPARQQILLPFVIGDGMGRWTWQTDTSAICPPLAPRQTAQWDLPYEPSLWTKRTTICQKPLEKSGKLGCCMPRKDLAVDRAGDARQVPWPQEKEIACSRVCLELYLVGRRCREQSTPQDVAGMGSKDQN